MKRPTRNFAKSFAPHFHPPYSLWVLPPLCSFLILLKSVLVTAVSVWTLHCMYIGYYLTLSSLCCPKPALFAAALLRRFWPPVVILLALCSLLYPFLAASCSLKGCPSDVEESISRSSVSNKPVTAPWWCTNCPLSQETFLHRTHAVSWSGEPCGQQENGRPNDPIFTWSGLLIAPPSPWWRLVTHNVTTYIA